jgi:hypothetical protein
MKRAWILAAAIPLGACSTILGIDDGIPRSDDASVDVAPVDVAVADVSDAASDAPLSPLSCGATTCNFAEGQACCRTGDEEYFCVSDAAACSGGTYIPCDRSSQCAATDAGKSLCCTTDVLTDSGIYVATSVGCHPSAQCSPIPTHYILCGDDSGADCPPEAGCGQSVSTLPPFLLCK